MSIYNYIHIFKEKNNRRFPLLKTFGCSITHILKTYFLYIFCSSLIVPKNATGTINAPHIIRLKSEIVIFR